MEHDHQNHKQLPFPQPHTIRHATGKSCRRSKPEAMINIHANISSDAGVVLLVVQTSTGNSSEGNLSINIHGNSNGSNSNSSVLYVLRFLNPVELLKMRQRPTQGHRPGFDNCTALRLGSSGSPLLRFWPDANLWLDSLLSRMVPRIFFASPKFFASP